jgi:hypothetical protein
MLLARTGKEENQRRMAIVRDFRRASQVSVNLPSRNRSEPYLVLYEEYRIVGDNPNIGLILLAQAELIIDVSDLSDSD